MKAGTTLMGGLVIDFGVPLAALPMLAEGASVPFAPNAFIRIDRQNLVTLVMPMCEMGQGVYTAMAMLLAEELEVGLDQVRLEHSPADDARYGNALLGSQITGNSTTIRAFWMPLRQAGAVARTMLVAAAAKRWSVEPSTCVAMRGVVAHTATSRRLTYGELVDEAAALPVPVMESVLLKQPEAFSLIGTPARRFEGPDKVAGKTEFGIDVRLPGMKIAAIAISPVIGGRAAFVNEKAARAVAGVRQVVNIGEAVAVVADHMGAANKGLRAAAITWDDGPNAHVDMDAIVGQLEHGSRQSGVIAKHEGTPDEAFLSAAQRVDSVYQMPFLAHAAMEPMNCTVHVTTDACEIWAGTQAPTRAQTFVAELTGLPTSAITIHNCYLGGGFGRRLDVDGTVLAVKIARRVDGPVKVVWSREEDIQHDLLRPYYYDRISAGLDAGGRLVAWNHRLVGSSVVARYFPELLKGAIDFDVIDSAAETPYACANRHVDYVRVEPPGVTTAFWRGVGLTHNVFVVESFIDELAHAAKQDPFLYRKDQVVHPRALAVLTLAAEKGQWGKPLPPRWGRGISLQFAFGSHTATVVELEVTPDGAVRVHRIVCAVDCGMVVNPDTVAAQFEGGSLFGLTAALHGAITLRGGRVQQSNFHDYRPLRMNEAPVVETHIVKSAESPGGVGENPTSAIAPAVTNAIFAATGVRIRTLPIDPALLRA